MSVQIGSGSSASTAADIILSIRDQIPDLVADAADDGQAFTLVSILRWLNDAGRIICQSAAPIVDWYAIPSASGMDVYELPQYIVNVEQAWYDNMPLTRSAELDDIFVTKIVGSSWWFGPHSLHATPRLHVWPACDRTAETTTVAAEFTDTAASLVVAAADSFLDYGFVRVGDELVLYRNIDTATDTVTNLLRGQGGTRAETHIVGTDVTECNIMFKCTRLPKPLTAVTDPIEIPQGLWPLLELYVLSKVREAEQEFSVATSLRQEFQTAIDKLAEKAQSKGLKQGLQVRLGGIGPTLFNGRTYIP